jgi:hypothetical protein
MAVAAFDDSVDELRIGNVEAKMAIDTIVGGWRQRASTFDGDDDKGGRWCLTVVMDNCCASSRQWTIDTSFKGGGGGRGVR